MNDAAHTLGEKLRRLDLDPPEQLALASILLRAQAAEPEVEAFGFDIGSLGFETRVPGVEGFKNSDGILRGGRGDAFKGSDEELQAIVDWLRD